MNWRRRIAEIVLAGGTLSASVGCWHFCNANPDPCCSDSSSLQCAAFDECAAEGGFWDVQDGCVFPDAGVPDAGG